MFHRRISGPFRLTAVAAGLLVSGLVLAGTASAATDQGPATPDGSIQPVAPLPTQSLDTADDTADDLLGDLREVTADEEAAETGSAPTPPAE